MKVLVVGPYYFDNMAWSVVHTLKGMGHAVNVFDHTRVFGLTTLSLINKIITHSRRLILREPERNMNRKLIRYACKLNPDLVIVISGASGNNVSPRCVETIQDRTGSKMVCWFGDAISNLGRQYIIRAPYNALFFKDPYIVNKLRDNLGRNNVFYLPQCCDPSIHIPVELKGAEKEYYGCDVAVVGNMYYYRTGLLKNLKNFDIKIWGATPPSWLKMNGLDKYHMRKVVWGGEKAKAFCGAKIVLNNNHYSEILGVNKRTFEAAACGGFQIIDNLSGLNDLFVVGKEIVVFDDLQDLKDKITYYINHPEERKKISALASKRARSEHTYEMRLKKLLKLSGFRSELSLEKKL